MLIWGIENKTIKPKPIADIRGFVSLLLSLAPQTTDPIVQGIDGDWIPSNPGTGIDQGFGLLYVPESLLPPHRVLLKHEGIKDHYYIRSGEDFVVASHIQLEDMFGRRPQPKLSLSKRIVRGPIISGKIFEFRIILGIENIGRGMAKSPFLSIRVNSPHKIASSGIDGTGHFGLMPLVRSMGSEGTQYGSSAHEVIHPGTIRDVTCVETKIDKSQSPLKIPDVIIHYMISAEGVRPIEGQESVSVVDLWNSVK